MCSRRLPRLSPAFFATDVGDLRVIHIRRPGKPVAGGSEELIQVWALQHGRGWFLPHSFCSGHDKNHPEVNLAFEWLGDCFFRRPGYCLPPGLDFLT